MRKGREPTFSAREASCGSRARAWRPHAVLTQAEKLRADMLATGRATMRVKAESDILVEEGFDPIRARVVACCTRRSHSRI